MAKNSVPRFVPEQLAFCFGVRDKSTPNNRAVVVEFKAFKLKKSGKVVSANKGIITGLLKRAEQLDW